MHLWALLPWPLLLASVCVERLFNLSVGLESTRHDFLGRLGDVELVCLLGAWVVSLYAPRFPRWLLGWGPTAYGRIQS